MKHFYTLILFFISFHAFAQLKTYPLDHPSNHLKTSSVIFFDDFSSKNNRFPDSQRWITNGVFLNNTLAIDAPTLYVATFDAYDKEAKPYDISSPLTTGFSDKLTSQKIDLSSYPTGATDIFLSFYWQEQGLGESPDPDDYLILRAKDKNGAWIELWRKEGTASPTTFTKENINITDAFFHADFQFEFERFGRNSGYYDVFHIDYVSLFKGVSDDQNDTYFPDVAYQNKPQCFLKQYTAMPLEQYLVDPSAYTNTTFTTTLRNLNNEPRVISNYQFVLYDTISSTDLILPIVPDAPSTAPYMNPLETFEFTANTAAPALSGTTSKVIEARFSINLVGDQEKDNDMIRSYAALDDYYAYDDGSAEYVAGIRQRFGKIAVKFETNIESRLSDIDICFVPFETDLSAQSFVLSVWKSIDGREEEVLFQHAYVVKYPKMPNGFIRFSMDEFIDLKVKGTFYVGIQQTTNDLLAIGFDKNNEAQDHTFQNTEGIWQQDKMIKGALMIRPVFSDDVVSGLSDDNQLSHLLKVFPNPTSDKIFYKGVKVKNAHMYDQLGQEINIIVTPRMIDIQDLPTGMYFLHFITQSDQVIIKKIIKK